MHAGADTGGCGWGLAGAFAKHPTIELRSSVRSTNYIDYPNDLPWEQAKDHAIAADVLHLHNTTRTASKVLRVRRPTVLHHHGTHYRDNARALNREVKMYKLRAVVATLDLLDYGPGLTWVPQAFELTKLPQRARRDSRAPGPLRVGHAPTNREIKSTDAFLAACEKIPGVIPVLIEGRSWAECLAAKATCDVYFDQVQLGYGCNAIEAWGMGLPVIAGAAPSTLVRMHDTFGWLPFLATTEDEIGDALKAMTEEDTRAHYAALGRAHVTRWHDGRETVRRLEPIYAQLAT